MSGTLPIGVLLIVWSSALLAEQSYVIEEFIVC